MLRAEDLVFLGVSWSDLQVVGSADTGPTVLEATTDNAVIVLHFPPQHIGEQALEAGSRPVLIDGFRVFASRLAGPSQVAFRVPSGKQITLTVEGLLAGLRGAHLVSGGADGTALELPYRVRLAPDVGSLPTFMHPPDTVSSPAGAVGLWRTRLAPATPGGPLSVTPLSVDQAEDPFPLPLTLGNRLSIENGGSPLTASCQRLELSALGGSLTAHAASASFDWEHQVALGRDVHVRTATVVRLYPFNHRAVFVETTDRVFDAVGHDQAALKKDSRLIILEHVVDLPVSDKLGRQFPFHRVELLDSVLPQVVSPTWTTFKRPSLTLDSLTAQRQSAQDSRDADLTAIGPSLAAPRTEQELLDEAFGPLLTLQEINGQLGEVQGELGPAEDALAASNQAADEAAALQRQIDTLQNQPVGPDGQLDPDTLEQIAELNQQIAELRDTIAGGNPQLVASLKAQEASLQAQAVPQQQAVDAELARPRTVDELASAGVPDAQEVVRLNGVIADLDAQIAEQLAGAAVETDWYFVPTDGNGKSVLFSVRVSGSLGDLTLSLPLIAVNDFSLPEAPGFAEYTSLTDPQTASAVGKAWTESSSGVVTMPPTPVGLVRAAQPQPGDVQEVLGLAIEGVIDGVGFRPLLSSFTVGLPEVRALLGDVKTTVLQFTPEFLTDGGDIRDLAFQLPTGTNLDISFLTHADRSGGLVSPRILADGISRQFGPVVSDGIRSAVGGQFDAQKLLADGATILGFNLLDLVKDIDTPPGIVSDLGPGGVPRVRMTWKNVVLHSSKQFVANPGAVLDLDVESSPSRTVTTCTVSNIALSLPTPETELLRLTFGQLTFTQEPGKAPSLDVSGLDMKFVGDLQLLQVLQQAVVGLGDNGPKVDASPTGVVASYSLPIPEVSTGSFVMRDIVFRAGIDVPFTGDPVVVTLGFASRDQPFNLSVLALGGGGYVSLQLDHTGLRSIEAALEFGATIAINFLIATAEVHAMGGIRFAQLPDKTVDLAGYIRIGGSVDVLGLVSVSVELMVELHYEPDSNEMVGHATLVVDIDLTLYSHKVELDSGRWAISGGALPFGSVSDGPPLEDVRAAWERYRKAFAA
jgi:hypothetical protein